MILATTRKPLVLRALRVLTGVLAIAWVLFVSTTQQVSNDFWLQAKIGELILQTHTIPATVLFPFTEIRNATFNAHEWLPSIGFHELLALLGEDSLPFIGGLLGLLLFIQTARLVYWRSKGNLGLALGLALVGIAVENYRHALRPELLSLVLFLACLDCLATLQKQYAWKKVALFALCTVVWANVHGSFFLAPLMAIIFGIGCRLDRQQNRMYDDAAASNVSYFGLALIALLCTLINPVGVHLWEFVVNFSTASAAKHLIIEWIPLFDSRVWDITGVWVGIGAMALCFALIWANRRSISHVDVLLGLFFIALACSAIRFLVYLGFVVAYIASGSAALRSRSTNHALAITLAFVVLLWGLVTRYGNVNGLYPSSNPDWTKLTAPMVEALAEPTVRGHVLVSYGLGAELIYRAYPRLQPSIDSRLDSYGDAYFFEHEALWEDPVRMKAFIERYDVRYVLTSRPEFKLMHEHKVLDYNQWQIRLVDSKVVLLERPR